MTIESKSLRVWLHERAFRQPDKTALAVGDDTITYAGLDDLSRAIARALLQEGIRPGERVGVHWGNSLDCALLLFACFQAGIIALPVNIRLKAPEIAYIMEHAGAVAWFSQPELAGIARAAAADLPEPLAIRTSLPSPLAEGDLPEIASDTLSVIMYTSGTTARPKGVTHSHGSLLACARNMASFDYHQDDVVLGTTSIMHASGLLCTLLGAMQAGGTAVLMPAFDPAKALDLMGKYGCTWVIALPAMLQQILIEQEQRPRELSSLRVVLSGGDVVPLALQERSLQLFPSAGVRELYAITEVCPVSCTPAEAYRPGSIGWPAPDIDMRVTEGEIAVRSTGNFRGYWNDEAATKAAIRDGWFLTGDLGHCDEDGFFWFKGRKKEIIIRGGSNISPQEVEEALYKHPAVREAGVIGMPHPVFGEEVVAAIALREGQAATEQDLCAFARAHLAYYKVPTRVLFLDALPKGITGKVQRRALKEMLATD